MTGFGRRGHIETGGNLRVFYRTFMWSHTEHTTIERPSLEQARNVGEEFIAKRAESGYYLYKVIELEKLLELKDSNMAKIPPQILGDNRNP